MKFFRRSEKYSFIAVHILSLISFFMLVMMADCADFPMTEMMDVPVTDLGRPIPFVTPTDRTSNWRPVPENQLPRGV
jgi:hypothetical protein